MSDETERLIAAALALPEEGRLRLVERLLESLPPEDGAEADGDLAEELERRAAEVEAGTAAPIPWDELREQT
jgi:putative addiction module component (TIGR02574 family)